MKQEWKVYPNYVAGNLYEIWDKDDNYPLDCSADAMEANAKLIAAAPDLLEALKWLIKEAKSMNDDLRKIGRARPDDGAHPDCPLEIARAAIAKATGEQQP